MAGFGMVVVGGGEFVEKQGNGAIMDRRGDVVDADGDFARVARRLALRASRSGLEGLDGFQEGGVLGNFLAVLGTGRRGGSEDGLVAAQAGMASVRAVVLMTVWWPLSVRQRDPAEDKRQWQIRVW